MKTVLSLALSLISLFGLYPEIGIITDLDRETDTVTVSTDTGIVWTFDGCEDYTEGDLVRLLMISTGDAESIRDDTILIHWYGGTLETYQNVMN